MQAVAKEIVEKLGELSTSCISDALDKIGIEGALFGIKGQTNKKRICGQAFTVHYVPCGAIKGTVGDFLDEVEAGQVVVIDNSGRCDCTVWGGIMAHVSNHKKLSGTLIDGVCRDISEINKADYAVFSKGTYMRTGKDRVEVDYINKPVSVSGIHVSPGDLIVGDENGAVCIPLEYVEKVYEIAMQIDKAENNIVAETSNGSSLKAAREKYGYHQLQSHTEGGSLK